MTAPESWWAPATLPFSSTATGTSPSASIISGSSSSSWSSRIAHARPAWPPPTIATPTSIRSSSGSVGGPRNSSLGSTGGGNSAGATPRPSAATALAALSGLHGQGELGDDLVEVPDHAEVGELEDRSVGVLVDRHDVLRALHADLVLDRTGDAGGEVDLGRHRLAGLPDLGGVGVPTRVDHRACRGNRAAQRARELLELLAGLGVAEGAAGRDHGG